MGDFDDEDEAIDKAAEKSSKPSLADDIFLALLILSAIYFVVRALT